MVLTITRNRDEIIENLQKQRDILFKQKLVLLELLKKNNEEIDYINFHLKNFGIDTKSKNF